MGAADPYPVKPIRVVQPFAPGGGVDAIARILQPKLAEALGQQLVMDYRPGAGGNISAELVAKSPPDGYTLSLGFSTVLTVNKSMYDRVNFDPIADFAPITQLVAGQYILIVHPSMPVRSIKDLITLAKAKPGSINYASAGIGSPQHLGGELLKRQAGIDIVHIAYKGGGPAAAATLAGEAQVVFGSVAASQAHLKSGRLRPVAMSGLRRSALMPELPTLNESGLTGFNVSNWHSFVAPAGTPRAVINRIHAESVKVLRMPEVAKPINNLGYEVTGTTPEELAEIIRSESAMWAKVIKDAKIRAE